MLQKEIVAKVEIGKLLANSLSKIVYATQMSVAMKDYTRGLKVNNTRQFASVKAIPLI